jgi:hypothetical protein
MMADSIVLIILVSIGAVGYTVTKIINHMHYRAELMCQHREKLEIIRMLDAKQLDLALERYNKES